MNDTTIKPELVEDSSSSSAEQQSEDYALWIKSEPFSTEYAERLASLLPSMLTYGVGAEIITVDARGTSTSRQLHPSEITIGLDSIVRVHEPGVLVVADLVGAGWYYSELERRVLAFMDEQVLQGLSSSIYGRSYIETYGTREPYLEETRPSTGGTKVQHTDYKPAKQCIPFHKQESSRYSSPNMRRSRGRGQPISHESRGVRANREPARDLEGAGQDRAYTAAQQEECPSCRGLAGPGQSRRCRYCKVKAYARAYGCTDGDPFFPKRPEKPI